MPHYFFFASTLRQNRENVCCIWFKIGSVARFHWTQGMSRFERSREKRYISRLASCRQLAYHMNDIASSVVRNFSSPCPHDKAPTIEYHKKVECCASAVLRCRIHRYIGFNSRYFSGIGIKVIKNYIWNIISCILSTTIPSRNVREVCPVWCVWIPLRDISRIFVIRNIRIINYCD